MSSSRPAAKKRQKVSQPTISFGAKSKITKASSALGGAHAKKGGSKKDAIKTQISVSASPSVSERESPPPPPTHTTAEIAIRQQAKEEVKKTVRSKQEERAAKVDDAQLKRYWRAKELERKAPRVHQGELSMNEKILRHFDLSSQYGPCVGITRMKRWNRADGLNLHPPVEVLTVLLKEQAQGEAKSERAYVDELL